jgi:galactofuranose transport system permease protein
MKALTINQRNLPTLAGLWVFLATYALGAYVFPGFASLRVLMNLFTDNAFIGVIAITMTFIILSGGIDLSIGSVIAFTGVFTAKLLQEGYDPILIIVLTLGLGALFGCVMGICIHVFEMPAFLVTLTGMFLARGGAFWLSLSSIPIKNEFFDRLVDVQVNVGFNSSLSLNALIFLVVAMAGIFIAHYTPFGRWIYAIGGDEASARMMGLPVGRVKVAIYTLNSAVCALAGLVFTLYTLSGYPLATVGLELDVIAAVVIGGTLLSGGVGYVEGTVIGVLILGLIQTLITFQGTLSSWWTRIFIGVLLFVFILLQTAIARSSSRQRA